MTAAHSGRVGMCGPGMYPPSMPPTVFWPTRGSVILREDCVCALVRVRARVCFFLQRISCVSIPWACVRRRPQYPHTAVRSRKVLSLLSRICMSAGGYPCHGQAMCGHAAPSPMSSCPAPGMYEYHQQQRHQHGAHAAYAAGGHPYTRGSGGGGNGGDGGASGVRAQGTTGSSRKRHRSRHGTEAGGGSSSHGQRHHQAPPPHSDHGVLPGHAPHSSRGQHPAHHVYEAHAGHDGMAAPAQPAVAGHAHAHGDVADNWPRIGRHMSVCQSANNMCFGGGGGAGEAGNGSGELAAVSQSRWPSQGVLCIAHRVVLCGVPSCGMCSDGLWSVHTLGYAVVPCAVESTAPYAVLWVTVVRAHAGLQ